MRKMIERPARTLCDFAAELAAAPIGPCVTRLDSCIGSFDGIG